MRASTPSSPTPPQHLLPEDNPLHRSDNVSTGLETSSARLLNQRAAEVAIDEALPLGPLESKTVRITGKKYLEGRPPVQRKGIDPLVCLDEGALVLHARLYDNSMQAPHPRVPGRYRVRVSVRQYRRPADDSADQQTRRSLPDRKGAAHCRLPGRAARRRSRSRSGDGPRLLAGEPSSFSSWEWPSRGSTTSPRNARHDDRR